MMNIRMTLEGGPGTGFFKRLADRITGATDRALRECAEEILKETTPLVPVETTALRTSGRVEKISRFYQSPEYAVVYGGAGRGVPQRMDVDYAVYVHENTQVDHPIGQAKFLEAGAALALPKCQQICQTVVSSAVHDIPDR